MSAGSTLPLWLRLGGPTGAVLGGGGAAAVHLTAVAAVLVGLAAAAVAVTFAGLLRSRS
jgi:hypothetical protein